MNEDRKQKIDQAVEAGIARWTRPGVRLESQASPEPASALTVIRDMPRRKPVHSTDAAHVTLPMARRVVFRAGIFLPVIRLFLWAFACLRFFAGNALDTLLGRGSIQRRAIRLREVFEGAGVSFAKLGQQLSLRADLLPYAYCAELSKMLDQAQPFPTPDAIAIIERSLGKPLHEVFEAFDPKPIGSASLACVYQAKLRTGEQVAVKVRRPGIGPLLAADLRALDWLLTIGEGLTIIRPGTTRDFRKDLRTMLLGELNFRAEARYTEIFRLQALKDGDGISAPKVYFDYCTDEVMVSELVAGVWMWELMAAVDRNDQEFLANVRTMGIDPSAVARRLVRALHRELLEHLFFHADPHPANLVILPDSKICFIDFGAVGRFSTDMRNTLRELQFHMRKRDIGRMVHCSVKLAGPLPPIDVDSVMAATAEIYADWVYAVVSTDAEWWERSSAQNWLRYINVAREYGVPVSLETIQFFRATLLYDSVLVRLDKDIDPVEEYESYARVAGKEAKKRLRKQVQSRMKGLKNNDYLEIEQVVDMATQFFFRIQQSVEDPIVQFRNIVGKLAYSMSLLVRLALFAGTVFLLALIAQFVLERWLHRDISWVGIIQWAASFDWIHLGALLLALVLMRRVLIRLNEPDRKPDSGR